MDKRQSAVEWLRESINKKLNNELSPYFVDLFDNAKAMEKQQMDKVSEDWFVEGCTHIKDNKRIYQSFEQYYNENYG
jgi:hypothetical protein